MSKTLDIMLASNAAEQLLEINTWIGKTPYLNFGAGYEVCPIYPFIGAQARLFVQKVGAKQHASIYLDTHGVLGCMDKPYWECSAGGDIERFYLDETKELVRFIKKQLSPKKTKSRKK